MKYLIYLLLLANVAYFGWNFHLQQTRAEVVRELPPLPRGAAPLVTLQELEQEERQQVEQQQQGDGVSELETLTMTQPPGAGSALSCQTLGPFLALDELQAVAAELRREEVRAVKRSTEVQQPNGFWVYLPAMKRKQALQAVKVLEENGDREYYVGKGNLLSLGIFTEKARAQRRLEETRKLGFDPVMEARFGSHTEYWLDVDSQKPVAKMLDAVVQGHPGLQAQETTCP